MVYGPGMKGNMLRLFGLVDRGVPLPFGAVRNRRSMLFVENAVDAFIAASRAPISGAELFLCSDRDDLSTPELVREIGRALGRRVRLLNVPESWFRAGGRVGDIASRFLPVPLTSAAVDRLLGSLYVDASRLARITGYQPRFSAAAGIARTAEWYRAVAP
jgi:nucleoside-diphosphate-sugar epimerase